jgi:AraC-like DNA-binding protein
VKAPLSLSRQSALELELSNKLIHLPRAAQIFTFDEARVTSSLAETAWSTRSEPFASFTSVAVAQWKMVVTKQRGHTDLTIRGPETRATASPIPEDATFLGVTFRLGAFMPDLPPDQLVDGTLRLPNAGTRSFWWKGSAWEFPTYDNVDVFLRRLVRKGLVVRDPIVQAALNERRIDVSLRSVQRRIRRATGLTHALVKQIERAEQAVALLGGGATILDAVERFGYADQAHLTRSLRRFTGHTPARIVRDFMG